MNQNEADAKRAIRAAIGELQDEDGRTKTRELALAVTKLQEATMWIEEHCRRQALSDSAKATDA